MEFSLRVLVCVTLVCCLTTHGTFVQTSTQLAPYRKPSPHGQLATLLSHCNIARIYHDTVPTGHTNVTSVFGLGSGMDLRECLVECCKVGPAQCQYAWLYMDMCFAVACSREMSSQCMPVLVKSQPGVEVTYVEMSFQVPRPNTGIAVDRPPTAFIQVDWVSPTEAYLYGTHSSDDKGIASYHWELLTYQRGITAEDANTDTLHLLRLLNGEYRVRLMVTDLAGQSNSTEVNFTVSRDHSTIDAFHDLVSELPEGEEEGPSRPPSKAPPTELGSSTATSVTPALSQTDQTGQTGDFTLEETNGTRTGYNEQSNDVEETSQSGRADGSQLPNETSQSSQVDHGEQPSLLSDTNQSTQPFTETSQSNHTAHDQLITTSQPSQSSTNNRPSDNVDLQEHQASIASGNSGKSKPNLFTVVAVPVLAIVALVLVTSAVMVAIPACCLYRRETRSRKNKQKYQRVPVGTTDA